MVVSIEEVSSSLVREYLSRKGLKRTIACMDEEQPRTEASINNRSDLRQILHMEGLYKNNKVQKNPLKTLLEIIVKHHIERHKNDKAAFSSDPVPSTLAVIRNAASTSPPSLMNETKTVDCTITKLRSFVEEETCSSQGIKSLPATDTPSTHNQTDFWRDCSESRKELPLNTPFHGTESFTGRESERKTESTQKIRTNRTRRGMMAAPIASTPQESNRKRQTRRVGVPQLLLGNEEDSGHSVHGPPESGIAEVSRPGSCRERQQSRSTPETSQCEEGFNKVGKDQLKTIKAKSPTGLHAYDLDMSEMILDDIDDDDDELRELSAVSIQASIPKHSYAGRAMDQHTATALKELLLGSSSRFFSNEWRNQGFTFSDDLKYGIMQNKGGPCGVLAAVQACLLKKLLFESADSSVTGLQRLRPSSATRTQCLVLAAAEVLWRAGEEKQATVAM
uniref:Ubiquitin carboxyl-terminal hydrolase MINDY n=1 Tax=Myripristis murdjan TaxID=586833 RepID=A0A668AT57_9TELE